MSKNCNKFERKILTFGLFYVFPVLQQSYLVKELDCNKKIQYTSFLTDSLLSTSCASKTPKQAHPESR